MTVDFVRTLTAVAALAANGLTLVIVGVLVAARFDTGARRLAVQIGDSAMALAGLVALACTAGSLYFSEVAHFIPCRYCWFQRIAMYPLVVVLLIGAVTRDLNARRYAVVLAAVGAATSTYHYLLQQGVVTESGACDPLAPCAAPYVWEFDFVSIPYMALSGFLLVLALLATTWVRLPDEGAPDDEHLRAEPQAADAALNERSDHNVEESVS